MCNFTLSSVKFSGLKLWLCKKSDKYEVCHQVPWWLMVQCHQGKFCYPVLQHTYECCCYIKSLKSLQNGRQGTTIIHTVTKQSVSVHCAATLSFESLKTYRVATNSNMMAQSHQAKWKACFSPNLSPPYEMCIDEISLKYTYTAVKLGWISLICKSETMYNEI